MRPEGYSLDRIDPFGNYEPGNLRWASAKEQANNIRDPEGRSAKISAAKQNMSPETREKMSASHTGKTMSPETREKIGTANKGKNHTPETRERMSAAKTGTIAALNIEIGEVKQIPTELYHSRKDIYFTSQSKVFKEWKKNYTDKV